VHRQQNPAFTEYRRLPQQNRVFQAMNREDWVCTSGEHIVYPAIQLLLDRRAPSADLLPTRNSNHL